VSAIENVRREFGGFSRLIRDDAEEYIGWLLNVRDCDRDQTTAIFLAQTGGSFARSTAARTFVEQETEPLLHAGWDRAMQARCDDQLGNGIDFVYACSIAHCQSFSMRETFELFCTIRLTSQRESEWRTGFGTSIHTAYVALSHAKANETWVDDAYSVFDAPRGVHRQVAHIA